MSTTSLFLAFAGLWLKFDNYLANYYDYPWLFLIPAVLLSTLGAWQRGLRTAALVMTACCFVWLGPILVPARTDLPISQRAGKYTATLRAVGGEPVIELEGPGNQDLGESVNLDTIEMRGQIGPLISVDLQGRRFHVEPTARNAVVLSPLEAPIFVRSVGICLKVSRWPSNPAVSLEVPIPTLGSSWPRMVEAKGGGLQLAIRDVRLGETTSRLPAIPAVALTVATEGLPGWSARNLRIRDQDGHPLQGHAVSVTGRNGGADVSIEIAPIPPHLKTLRFDLYSDDQLEGSILTFQFDRAPGRK